MLIIINREIVIIKSSPWHYTYYVYSGKKMQDHVPVRGNEKTNDNRNS